MKTHGKEILSLLENHRLFNQGRIATLNRIFRKCMLYHHPRQARGLPRLSQRNVKAKLEYWGIEKLRKILTEVVDEEPARIGLPIIVIKYRGRTCLLDGRRRISYWSRRMKKEKHPVWVLRLKDE